MKSTYSVLALTSALVLALAAPVLAEEKKEGTNQTAPDAAAKAKTSEQAAAVQQMHLAHTLIDYGRKNKVPEALITAARILSKIESGEQIDKPTHQTVPDAPKSEKKDKPGSNSTASDLLAEAKKMSNNNPAIVSLADSVVIPTPKGAKGGPRRTVEVVEPLATDEFKITFVGEEVARVAISGDGDTRLDLYVYDENGNLVASQVGPGDDCLASWVPRWTGVFRVRVVNRGRLPNKYVIATN